MFMALWLQRVLSPAIRYHVVRYHTNFEPTPPKGMLPPLRGIKVLDLTRVLAGPTATMVCQYKNKTF